MGTLFGCEWRRAAGGLFATLLAWMPRNCRWRIRAALARAIDWVARGEVVHLVREGRPVADLVPAGTDSRAVRAQHAARAIMQWMADRFGAPTLAHYRRVYESCGHPWPGEEEIRRRFPVADAC
jgi:antitoxin (DNA-binding transcriptional repressor) of toxin-antitoxin stability system